jgi:hypothetical protein
MNFRTASTRLWVTGIFLCLSSHYLVAQTDMDAIMLKKQVFCVGGMFSTSSWTDYWEGTFKRDNANLGKVKTNMYAVMGNYGINDRVNLLFSLPYVTTKTSAGTLKGLHGIQDLSLALKWMAYTKTLGTRARLSVFGVGKLSLPASNYVADFLPMSIGFRSKTAGLRLMVDYQFHDFFATVSGNYTYRDNIDIDRDAYYTTEMHYTNEVKMPDQSGYAARAGYRSKRWIAEGVVENVTTLGGFDMRKNDMPFPSNEMNMTQAGVNIKYSSQKLKGLEITGGGRYVIHGRNVGQATTVYAGVFYLMDLASKRKQRSNQ